MGSIGGLLGVAGGAGGTGFAGPAAADITNPTSQAQLSTAYQGAQSGLNSQQALLAAIQAQNGLGNQSQVYGQLQGVANGTGPNPAQAQLAQATGANVANQAALAAAQRGAGANVGLMARQAGQIGANAQQNSAGQAASMQANQSLNALGMAGNMANTQAGNQIGATTANTQAQLAEQQALLNAQGQYNNAQVQMQGNLNQANAGLAGTMMQGQQALIGGAMKAGGSGAAALAAPGATGGEVKKMAEGGFLGPFASGPSDMSGPNVAQISMPGQNMGAQALSDGISSFGAALKKRDINQQAAGDAAFYSPGQVGTAIANPALDPVTMSGGSGSLDFGAPGTMRAAQGGDVGSKLKSGGHVPGKAKVSGNSYSNDTVKALLSPGEVVIPRNVMQSSDPVSGAAKFVQAILSKKGKK